MKSDGGVSYLRLDDQEYHSFWQDVVLPSRAMLQLRKSGKTHKNLTRQKIKIICVIAS